MITFGGTWSCSVLVLCHKPFDVKCMCHNLVIMFSSPVIFKLGSSGQSRTAPSPSLFPSLSWREPSGKSSSPRLSKKRKKKHKHCLTAQPCLPSANITRFFSRPLGTSATTCHTPLRVSVASPQHLSSLYFFSSSTRLLFAETLTESPKFSW